MRFVHHDHMTVQVKDDKEFRLVRILIISIRLLWPRHWSNRL